MLAEQRIMNLTTYRKCFVICDNVRNSRRGKKLHVRDYPAAVVACAPSWNMYNEVFISTTGKVDTNSYKTVPHLESELMKLGPIGYKGYLCSNYVGACAEPHAARGILSSYPCVTLTDLVFSYAFRPRTKNVIRYCRNCVSVFNLQNL